MAYNNLNFENNFDPNNNFSVKCKSKCNYYTDPEFRNNMCKLNGFILLFLVQLKLMTI